MVLNCLNDTAFISPDGQEEACTPPKEDRRQDTSAVTLAQSIIGYLAGPSTSCSIFGHDGLGHLGLGALAVAPLQWPERFGPGRSPSSKRTLTRYLAHGDGGLFLDLFGDRCERTVAGLAVGPFCFPSCHEVGAQRRAGLAVVDSGLTLRSMKTDLVPATQIAHGKAMNAVPVERIVLRRESICERLAVDQ